MAIGKSGFTGAGIVRGAALGVAAIAAIGIAAVGAAVALTVLAAGALTHAGYRLLKPRPRSAQPGSVIDAEFREIQRDSTRSVVDALKRLPRI